MSIVSPGALEITFVFRGEWEEEKAYCPAIRNRYKMKVIQKMKVVYFTFNVNTNCQFV